MTLQGTVRVETFEQIVVLSQAHDADLKAAGLTRIAYDPTSHPKSTARLAPLAFQRALDWAERQTAQPQDAGQTRAMED